MNVNNNTTGAVFFQGVRHIRKVQKTSTINLTSNNNNHSLSRVSSFDSKVSSDDKLPAPKNSAIVKKQTIFIYPPERNLSNSNAHSAKLLPSRDNSLTSLPKLAPAISSSKIMDNNELLTPQRQNNVKIPQNSQNNITTSQFQENKTHNLDKTRVSVRRQSDKVEKEKENNNNKAYLKRPTFILKQKEMFHYGDKLHDLIEKEKKEYIEKKTQRKSEVKEGAPVVKTAEKNPQNFSE